MSLIRRNKQSYLSIIKFIILLLLVPTLGMTQNPLKEIMLVGDIDHAMPAMNGDVYNNDDGILTFDVINSVVTNRTSNLGVMPLAEIDGYHAQDACDIEIYSIDTSAEVTNVVMRASDVFNSNGTKVLDATAEAIPYGVNVDAISRHPDNCDLIFSIDTIAEINGNIYLPSDLISYSESGGISLFHRFNFSENIDAIHMLENDVVLLSLDITANINGTVMFDDDVFEFDINTDTVNISFSPEAFNQSWQSADVNAIWASQLMSGTMQWQLNSTSVPEEIGTLNLTVNRTGGTDGDVVVSFASEAGSAVSDDDFIGVNHTLTLLDGQSFAILPISIIDDNLIEGIEEFTVSITEVTGSAMIGAISEIEIVITDNDNDDAIFNNSFENPLN